MQSKSKILKATSFSLMGVIIILLIAGSVVEQICGTANAVRYVYTAPWTIIIWCLAVISSLLYIFTTKMIREQLITFLLHFSFVVILAGAMTTHLFGKQGQVHLRMGQEAEETDLPFELTLVTFDIDYYPGTQAPMDFISVINCDGQQGTVSMNKVFRYKNYRFYQSGYDTDMQGTALRYSYDPYGIAITYAGYLLLLISMLMFFVQKRTHFRALLKSVSAIALLLITVTATASNQNVPKTLSRDVAKEWGNLYVYYNDRVCPMQTLAIDFTTKLYGKSQYKGLTAEQVLTGWVFFYDDWVDEPIIKIKGKDVRAVLGIDGKYASLNDFYGKNNAELLKLVSTGNKNAKSADEKFRLISMICNGTMFRIFPIEPEDASVVYWSSLSDQMSYRAGYEDWQVMYGGMEYVALCVAKRDNKGVVEALQKLRLFQEKKAGVANLPTPARFDAERMYNKLNYTRPMAMLNATFGILLFILICILLSQNKTLNPYLQYTFTGLMIVNLLFLTFALVLRWVVSHHIPLSNGFETMQFMAWVSALISSILSVRGLVKYSKYRSKITYQLILPFGYLICGMTMMVSMMSASNPQITNLMPVLQSPLLTFHVAIIMIAYCLLAFVMLNGVAALAMNMLSKKPNEQRLLTLMRISQLLLYPAVFCLTIGIFLGAVWANISWGRYWGWDPKEVWALITMLIYAVMLHTNSLAFLRKPIVFHIYSVIAFLFVLFTYFGVNFVLGGLHSYA